MLIQLHHEERKTGKSEMIAQREINGFDDLCKFRDDICPEYPLSDGRQWLILTEHSRRFVREAVLDGQGNPIPSE